MVGVGGSVEAADPNAYFTKSPRKPVVDEVVTFSASPSPGDDIQYRWIFEDGHEPIGMVVNHTFQTSGRHLVVLVVTNSTGGVDSYSSNFYVGEDIDTEVGIAMFGFFLAYMLFYFLIIFFFVLFYALNAIIGGILAFKVYQRGKDHDQMDAARPYLVAHLIAGLVSIFMAYLCIPSIIAHIVIYTLFKGKMREMGIDISKDKKSVDKKPRKAPLKPPKRPAVKHASPPQ